VLNDVPCGRTRRSNRFGEEAAERDGSDADDDAPPDLTGDDRQSPVQIPTDSYVEKRKHKPQNPIDAL